MNILDLEHDEVSSDEIPLRVITGIYSDDKSIERREAIRSTYWNDLPNPYFVIAKARDESVSEWNEDCLMIRGSEATPDGPELVWRSYVELLECLEFDYFLKLYDDNFVQTYRFSLFLRSLNDLPREEAHYLGYVLTSDGSPKSWVANHEVDQVPDNGGIDYCDGRLGVLLSRSAMELLVGFGKKRFLGADSAEESEDQLHAHVLRKHQIRPMPIPSGMIAAELEADDIVAWHEALSLEKEGLIKLHFGCEQVFLQGWLNIGYEWSFTDPFPLKDQCADFIYMEHWIQTLPYGQAYHFLAESKRLLRPGGVLRIAVPSIVRMVEHHTPEYLNHLKETAGADGTLAGAVRSVIYDGETRSLWSWEILSTVLRSLEFDFEEVAIGQSKWEPLKGLESRGELIGDEFNAIETLCVEATNPRTKKSDE